MLDFTGYLRSPGIDIITKNFGQFHQSFIVSGLTVTRWVIYISGLLVVVAVNAEICYVGGSSPQSNHGQHHWSWSLTDLDPCKCTKILTTNGIDITSSVEHVLRDYLKCGTCRFFTQTSKDEFIILYSKQFGLGSL